MEPARSESGARGDGAQFHTRLLALHVVYGVPRAGSLVRGSSTGCGPAGPRRTCTTVHSQTEPVRWLRLESEHWLVTRSPEDRTRREDFGVRGACGSDGPGLLEPGGPWTRARTRVGGEGPRELGRRMVGGGAGLEGGDEFVRREEREDALGDDSFEARLEGARGVGGFGEADLEELFGEGLGVVEGERLAVAVVREGDDVLVVREGDDEPDVEVREERSEVVRGDADLGHNRVLHCSFQL